VVGALMYTAFTAQYIKVRAVLIEATVPTCVLNAKLLPGVILPCAACHFFVETGKISIISIHPIPRWSTSEH
jgi:hypothetical protein